MIAVGQIWRGKASTRFAKIIGVNMTTITYKHDDGDTEQDSVASFTYLYERADMKLKPGQIWMHKDTSTKVKLKQVTDEKVIFELVESGGEDFEGILRFHTAYDVCEASDIAAHVDAIEQIGNNALDAMDKALEEYKFQHAIYVESVRALGQKIPPDRLLLQYAMDVLNPPEEVKDANR